MASFDEYLEMGEANFNLVLNRRARFAADDMMERLGMPYVEMTRFYDIRKIRRQYELLGGALGVQFKDSLYAVAATIFLDQFRKNHPQLTFAIGQSLNANPFELAAALISYGYKVERILQMPRRRICRTSAISRPKVRDSPLHQHFTVDDEL